MQPIGGVPLAHTVNAVDQRPPASSAKTSLLQDEVSHVAHLRMLPPYPFFAVTVICEVRLRQPLKIIDGQTSQRLALVHPKRQDKASGKSAVVMNTWIRLNPRTCGKG